AYIAVEKYLLVKQGIFNSTRQRGPVGFVLSAETQAQIDVGFEELRAAVDRG
ncbi:MAG: dihydrodipicolinate synthase family protein, partial [Chloroflexi bacterium]